MHFRVTKFGLFFSIFCQLPRLFTHIDLLFPHTAKYPVALTNDRERQDCSAPYQVIAEMESKLRVHWGFKATTKQNIHPSHNLEELGFRSLVQELDGFISGASVGQYPDQSRSKQ